MLPAAGGFFRSTWWTAQPMDTSGICQSLDHFHQLLILLQPGHGIGDALKVANPAAPVNHDGGCALEQEVSFFEPETMIHLSRRIGQDGERYVKHLGVARGPVR